MSDSKFRELLSAGANPTRFRPNGPFYSAIFGYIFITLFAYTLLVYTDDHPLQITTTSATAILAFYLLLQRPKIHFTDSGIGIENPLTSIYIPWRYVKEIGTKYSMVVETESGNFRCWAAIAPGRYQHRAVDVKEMPRGLRDMSQIKAAESPRSDSGSAAHIARERLAEFKGSNANGTDFYITRHSWLRVTVVLGAILSFGFSLFHA